ncbi:hypothetical protein [Burkholderia sp. IMCC1007]|uniref:hypothetical protein n=1 Tax=Burkholderia sp. IMCC1007 TaxID=3004104 RepID=UPI0022B4B783|nr:hypothetical protein [Burkholderia sp. IMCC1007]
MKTDVKDYIFWHIAGFHAYRGMARRERAVDTTARDLIDWRSGASSAEADKSTRSPGFTAFGVD